MAACSEGGRNSQSVTNTNKILPDDPRGLPWEIWQLVLSHLTASDLGHACCVCRTWNSLVHSLDASRWRELYLQSTEWKSPYWPLNPESRPPSWKNSLRDQFLSAKFWYHGSRSVDQSQCMVAFRRHRDRRRRRKTIQVGRNSEYDTLKSALSVANDYDRILISPGIYDEQFEMSSKIPLELMGSGELGSVILVMCVEQTSVTGRLCNLVLRAPWFTSFALKVKAGYIQVDNCIIEDGLVLIQNPGTCHFKFCTFRHANIILQHVNVSLIENCEFSQCDLAALSIEGFPKDELNWAHGHLSEITDINRDSICPDSSEDGTKSTFSTQTKSSGAREAEYGHGAAQGEAGNRTRSNDWLFENDDRSVSSSTVFRNVSSWLISADQFGSEMTLTTLSDHHKARVRTRRSSLDLEHCTSHAESHQDKHALLPVALQENEPRHDKMLLEKRESIFSAPGDLHSGNLLESSDTIGLEVGSENGPGLNKSTILLSQSNEFGGRFPCSSDLALIGGSQREVGSQGGIRHGEKIGSHSQGEDSSKEVTQLQGATGPYEMTSGSKGVNGSKRIIGSHDVMVSKGIIGSHRVTGSHNEVGSHGVIESRHDGIIGSNKLIGEYSGAEGQTLPVGAKSDSVLSHNSCDLSDAEGHIDVKLGGGRGSHGLHRTAGSVKPDDQILTELEIDDDLHDHQNGDNSTVTIPNFESAGNLPPEPDCIQLPEKCTEDSGPVYAWVSNDQLNPTSGVPGSHDRSLPPVDLVHEPADVANDEFVLDDLSSEDNADSSDLEHVEDSSTVSSSSSSDTFSHTETSLSDEELLVHLSYPQHRRPLQATARNSVHMETSTTCKSKRMSSGKTKRASLGVLTLWEDSDVVRAIEEVQGVTIRNCRMNLGKGAVMVSCQGHARVIGCHITNMGYGIRCVQNSRVLVLKNEIHHCRTSGIFMRLAASGVIAGNDIHSNMEAGVDVRKNADPIIQGNQIHHGERFGIAVLCSGQGQIRDNDIFANAEAGIYILYRGNPLISDNRLLNNQAAGISVNENGLGFVKDNMISGNLWAGVYVRHGGDPFVQHNVICNGVADGVVIGEKGRGTIAKNVITGNSGCGVWIMGGECPLLHCNDISNNGDSGIAFVTNGSAQTEHESRGKESNSRGPANMAIQELFIEEEKRETKPHYSQTKVQHNTICHNAGHGLSVESGKDVVVRSNSIYGNSLSGVYVNHPGIVTVHNNHITCNQETGLTTSSTGQAKIIGNGILDNKAHGILCQNEAMVCENDVIGNQSAPAITLQGTNRVKVEKNRLFRANAAPVIQLMDCAEGITVRYNQICVSQKQVDKAIKVFKDSGLNAADNAFIEDDRDCKDPANSGPPPFPWKPGDPAARPHRHEPDNIPVLSPVRYVRSVATVTNPESGNCQGGSRTCDIL